MLQRHAFVEIDDIVNNLTCMQAKRFGLERIKLHVLHYMKLAKLITGHQHILCGFPEQSHAWWYFDNHLALVEFTPDFSQLVFGCTQSQNIDPKSPWFDALQHQLSVLDRPIMSASAVDLIAELPNVLPAKAILFSEKPHQINHDAWQVLLDTCGEHIKRFEVEHENESIKEMIEEQEALNFAKTKFFSIIAHDLRAPFHGLLGFSEVLATERHELPEASVQRMADYLYDTAQSTYNLLENLLNWAMAENGRFTCHPVHFHVTDVVKIVTQVLEGYAAKKEVCLKCDIPPDVMAYADINMLTSVVQNLTSNALKFSHVNRKAEVTIQAYTLEDSTCIEVHDTGLGMTPQQIERLFKPRTVPSQAGTAGEKGTGLGLVLCKRFIDLNFGEISVQSSPDQGTTFIVRLASHPEQWQKPFAVEMEAAH